MKPEVEIYGTRTRRFRVESLSAEMNEGMHDLVTAWLPNPGELRADDIKGKPCRVVWGTGASTTSVFGYVDTTTALDYDNSPIGGQVLMVLGASSVMRSGQARSWRRSSPTRIARNIVGPYRLSLVTDKYVSTVDSFMQSDDSDWAALNRLADVSGMSLVARNTAVRMVDVRKEIGRAQLRPVLSLPSPDNFVQVETPSPVGFDTYEFTGIDSLGSTFTVRGGPEGGVKRHSSQNFTSLEEARLAKDRQQDRERFYVRAVAEFDGHVNARPGDVLSVAGNLWYVAKCKHEVAAGTAQHHVTMELHRSSQRRPASAAVDNPPTSTLRNGKWVAAQRYEVEL